MVPCEARGNYPAPRAPPTATRAVAGGADIGLRRRRARRGAVAHGPAEHSEAEEQQRAGRRLGNRVAVRADELDLAHEDPVLEGLVQESEGH